MAYQDYMDNGGGQPAKPPTPPAPPAAGDQAAGIEQTAAQKAGYQGETKESGSDPNRGDKQWDPQWEKRMRKKLGDKVGSLGDLYDPKHRQWLNKQARKQRGAGAGGGEGAEEVAPTGEETPPEEAVTPEAEATTGLPVAQGSADQMKGLETPDWEMPGRQVPGGEEMQDPTSQMETGLWTPEDQARQDAAAGGQEQLQTGLWTPEDEARASAADQAGGLEPGGGGGGGTAPTGEMYVTNAGVAPPDYPKPNTGSSFSQPTTPWPPPPVQPTYYTGGM